VAEPAQSGPDARMVRRTQDLSYAALNHAVDDAIYAPVNMQLDSFQLTGSRRFGLPTFVALSGREDATGDRGYMVAFEWPEEYQPLEGSSAERKRRNEERQLARVRADFKADGLRDPFTEAQIGSDPPDFRCIDASDGSVVGVEMTQLTTAHRAEDHALFRQVKRTVLGRAAIARRRFAHLERHLVAVSFVDDNMRPAKPIRPSSIPTLVQALEDFRPPIESGPLPEQRDPSWVREFPGGVLSSARFPTPPDTRFFRLTGFELAFSTPSWIRERDAWGLLVDRVRDHDQPGVDVLVAVAGSPTPSGLAYPTDDLLIRAALERSAATVVETCHIHRIWLHSWALRG
jgi:hypothetical protein